MVAKRAGRIIQKRTRTSGYQVEVRGIMRERKPAVKTADQATKNSLESTLEGMFWFPVSPLNGELILLDRCGCGMRHGVPGF